MTKERKLPWLSAWASTAVDLFYPRQCQFCCDIDHCRQFPFLCDDCLNAAPCLESPMCQICSFPFFGQITSEFQCPNCTEMRFCFDRAVALVRFQGIARYAIHALKYAHEPQWGKVLQFWMFLSEKFLANFIDVDMALPVPLHSVRERERGFNQACFLLEVFSQSWHIPIDRFNLVRVRKTETQTHLDRQERLMNLKGAFVLRRPELIVGKRILLVDDVFTTGATTSECARILKGGGATSVLVFTLARS